LILHVVNTFFFIEHSFNCSTILNIIWRFNHQYLVVSVSIISMRIHNLALISIWYTVQMNCIKIWTTIFWSVKEQLLNTDFT
jgi:hypothetical protein